MLYNFFSCNPVLILHPPFSLQHIVQDGNKIFNKAACAIYANVSNQMLLQMLFNSEKFCV